MSRGSQTVPRTLQLLFMWFLLLHILVASQSEDDTCRRSLLLALVPEGPQPVAWAFRPWKSLQTIKGNSSKWINERSDRLSRFAWQVGYGAFSVSASQVDTVRRYICMQKQHHQKTSFREEIVLLLEKHGIDYDERYLWD